MLTQEEVRRAAHLRRLRLIDQIWKDYLQDLLLHLLYRRLPALVFGGGTCLWKVYKGDRFSEDIDAYASPIPPDLAAYLQKELGLLGVACAVRKQRRTANMLFLDLALSFPSHPREVPLSVEILSEKPKETAKATLYPPYPDLPPVEMTVLSPEALLVNKALAVCGRDRPRDVHDLYLLLKQGTPVPFAAIRKRLPRFSLALLEERILEKRKAWESLGPLLVTKLPPLKEEAAFILSAFGRIEPASRREAGGAPAKKAEGGRKAAARRRR